MSYKKIGDLIQLVDVRNKDLSITHLVGLTINKKFIPSVANTIGTDMSNYKIIRKNQFACSTMQVRRDKKMPVALLKEFDVAIISQAYPVFEVIDEKELLPEYLMLWFSRSEFDREACFHAVGGVRGSLEWEDFCNMELPVPSIEKQREIVAQYQAVANKIKVNEQICEKLEATAQTLYKQWFVDFEFPVTDTEVLADTEALEVSDGVALSNSATRGYKSSGGKMVWNEELEKEIPEGWEVKSLKQIGKVITGKTPSSSNPEDFGEDFQFITPSDFVGKKVIIDSYRKLSLTGKERLENKINRKNTVLVTCIGSDMGKVSLCQEDCITNQQINSLIGNKEYYTEYLYYKLTEAKEVLKSIAVGGSTMPMLSKSQFELIDILMPKDELLKQFANSVSSITNNYSNYLNQNQKLTQLQSLLLSRLATLEG